MCIVFQAKHATHSYPAMCKQCFRLQYAPHSYPAMCSQCFRLQYAPHSYLAICTLFQAKHAPRNYPALMHTLFQVTTLTPTTRVPTPTGYLTRSLVSGTKTASGASPTTTVGAATYGC